MFLLLGTWEEEELFGTTFNAIEVVIHVEEGDGESQ